MMTDLFWDEVLLTNNPDSKELEVSFKKIDGEGNLTSAGDEPGTPGGTEEGPDGCVNSIGLVSDDSWLLRNNEPHWIWITLGSIPTEEYTVTIEFTDGTLIYPEYTTQKLDWLITPGSYEGNEEGVRGIKIPLTLGDVSRLTDAGSDTATYNAAITAVNGIAVDCWQSSPVALDFDPNPQENPPDNPDDGGSGGPIPPTYTPENPNPCEPGIDCEASANLIVNSGSRAGVFGLYPEQYRNQPISIPLVSPVFGTAHQILKGDGELSGWASGSSSYGASNLSLKNYLLSDNISVCGEDVDVITGFRSDVFVTSEWLSGGADGSDAFSSTGEGSFKQTANFVTYTSPPGSTVTGDFTTTLVVGRSINGGVSQWDTSNVQVIPYIQIIPRTGLPHLIKAGPNLITVGEYDFSAPGAQIVTWEFFSESSVEWDTTDEDNAANNFLRFNAAGYIKMIGSGASGDLIGWSLKSSAIAPSSGNTYRILPASVGSGLNRGVARYDPVGTILSGGTGGDDIRLAVQRSVSTYQTPSYCSRIP